MSGATIQGQWGQSRDAKTPGNTGFVLLSLLSLVKIELSGTNDEKVQMARSFFLFFFAARNGEKFWDK